MQAKCKQDGYVPLYQKPKKSQLEGKKIQQTNANAQMNQRLGLSENDFRVAIMKKLP